MRLTPRVWHLCAWRAILHIAGLWLMFASLRFLPLADAVAIALVMPFIMLILGRYVLDEHVGARRLAACVVGFIGTLMVVQPSFAFGRCTGIAAAWRRSRLLTVHVGNTTSRKRIGPDHLTGCQRHLGRDRALSDCFDRARRLAGQMQQLSCRSGATGCCSRSSE